MQHNRLPLLQVRGIIKDFAGLRALNNVSLDLSAGELVGLIGPNGSGKTTFFNILAGVVPATSGEVTFAGSPILGLTPHQIARHGIARTYQKIRLFPTMSVRQNVMVGQYLRSSLGTLWARLPSRNWKDGSNLDREVSNLIELVGLSDWSDHLAQNLPVGLQKLLEIARALACHPKLLLVDEPAAGLNEEESAVLQQIIARIHREFDLTILLVEHDLDVIFKLCKRVVVLNYGDKIFDGPAEAARQHPEVIRAYLGSSEIKA